MKPKTLLLVALGMTCSFCLMLALMITLFRPSPQKTRSMPRVTASRGQPVPPQQPSPQPPLANGDDTTEPIISSPPQSTDTSPNDRLARQELDAMRQTIKGQLDQLKADRNQKIAALASQLANLPGPEAAAQLKDLDDEINTLVLKRLKPAQRRALLKNLPTRQAARLRKRL